jgi:hypothetical protein
MSAKKKFDQRPPWLFGSCLTTTEREVYTALYSHKWMKDGARPSIQKIADMVGVSKSVVKAVIRRLTRLGVLVVEPRVKGNQRLPNAYTFPDPPPSFFTAGQRVADVPEVGRLATGGGAADNPTPQAAGNPGMGRPAVPEVDRDEVEQEQADISGSAGQAASGGYALRGSQEGPKGWGQAGATAGTAGSSLLGWLPRWLHWLWLGRTGWPRVGPRIPCGKQELQCKY